MSCQCSSLGFRKSFPVTFQASLAGSLKNGNNGRALLPLGGKGKLDLFFSATHDPKILAIQLEDISLMLKPLNIKVPGLKNPVNIPQTLLGKQVFDVPACTGFLNVATKDVTLNLRLVLTHDCFPQLAVAGINAPVSVRIVENGQLDLVSGTLNTRAASFDASGGVMHSLIVHPGGRDESSALTFRNHFGSGDANMTAKAAVGVNSDGKCVEGGGAEILICPGHVATLCWRSSGLHPRYSAPGLAAADLSSSGALQVKPTVSTKYHFEVESSDKDKDGNPYLASADVTVDVVTAGMSWEMDFSANPYSGVWEQNISQMVADPDIVVESMIIEPCPSQQSLFDALTIVYTPNGGGPRSFNVYAKEAQPIGVPLVGDWKLSLGGVSNDGVRGTVCISAILKCR
jgi:hypothetical protein